MHAHTKGKSWFILHRIETIAHTNGARVRWSLLRSPYLCVVIYNILMRMVLLCPPHRLSPFTFVPALNARKTIMCFLWMNTRPKCARWSHAAKAMSAVLANFHAKSWSLITQLRSWCGYTLSTWWMRIMNVCANEICHLRSSEWQTSLHPPHRLFLIHNACVRVSRARCAYLCANCARCQHENIGPQECCYNTHTQTHTRTVVRTIQHTHRSQTN